MGNAAALQCSCGTVRGTLAEPSPKSVNRVICYCDDCQAFAHALSRKDLLDPQGGTDIVQVAPASLSFTAGADTITGMRLSEKGLIRWFAACCKTPLGNTVGPALPFVGIVTAGFRSDTQDPDRLFGAPIGAVHGKFAVGEPPDGATGLDLRFMARIAWLLLGWRLSGQGWPNPFFVRETKAPRFPIKTLTPEEREALRPLCGPKPAA